MIFALPLQPGSELHIGITVSVKDVTVLQMFPSNFTPLIDGYENIKAYA